MTYKVVYEFVITGEEPLMVNNPEKQIQPRTGKGTNKTGMNKVIPVEDKLYVNKEGKYIIPSLCLKASIKSASRDLKIGRKNCMNFTKKGLYIEPAELVISPQKWIKDGRTVVINRKDRIFTERPVFPEWSLKGKIRIEDEVLTEEIVKQLLNDAGAYKGLGTFRDEFGKFRVDLFKKLD